MARYAVGWVDIADDQYHALPNQQQRLVDARISQLLEDPVTGSFHDQRTDQWTTTDSSGTGLITYVFRGEVAPGWALSPGAQAGASSPTAGSRWAAGSNSGFGWRRGIRQDNGSRWPR